MSARRPTRIEIVEDRSAEARCDEGFLTLRRLVVRNVYDDGTTSAPYPCDAMERPGSDAVVCVLYEWQDARVRVLLRESTRVPIFLRSAKSFVHPDRRTYLTVLEVVAGLVEPSDAPGPEGIAHRAAAEAHEEAGISLDRGAIEPLGEETFASPGTTDEKLFFCAAEADLEARGEASGDGSVMEEWAAIQLVDLGEAIRLCRDGTIPDMKTELALLRLADRVGYVPSLDRYLGRDA